MQQQHAMRASPTDLFIEEPWRAVKRKMRHARDFYECCQCAKRMTAAHTSDASEAAGAATNLSAFSTPRG
jgi:hypothetical protein